MKATGTISPWALCGYASPFLSAATKFNSILGGAAGQWKSEKKNMKKHSRRNMNMQMCIKYDSY